MADDGDKTEEASERKIQEARKKGQVAISRDLVSGLVFIVIFVTLSLTAISWSMGLVGYFRTSFRLASQSGPVTPHLVRGLTAMVDVLETPLLAALLAALTIGFMQTGGLFAPQAVKFDPQKVMPNFKRLVSTQTVMEVIKGFVKVTLAGAVAWVTLEPLLAVLTHLTGMKPMNLLVVLGHVTDKVGLRLVLVVAVIGAADFLWQRHSYLKGLRMSREDQKREYKDSEGDPQHKQERKRLHKELLEGRMISDVKQANFVVVNPTHIAVAIRYDRDTDAAPTVLAKGERLLAERIKQAAREAGVPIFRDVSLARALKDVEEGDEVPEALYEAIAEILRVVYGQEAHPSAPVAPPPAAAAPVITSDAPRASWRRG